LNVCRRAYFSYFSFHRKVRRASSSAATSHTARTTAVSGRCQECEGSATRASFGRKTERRPWHIHLSGNSPPIDCRNGLSWLNGKNTPETNCRIRNGGRVTALAVRPSFTQPPSRIPRAAQVARPRVKTHSRVNQFSAFTGRCTWKNATEQAISRAV